jgi:UDP-3-O-[3-hydroxymyristoyl] glucosamine N-acyltransferase
VPVAALAALLGAEQRGDSPVPLSAVDGLETAGPGSLSFIRDAKYARSWMTTNAGAVLVSRPIVAQNPELFPERPGHALLIVDDADLALIEILRQVAPPLASPSAGVHPTAIVDPSASIDPSASVGPRVVIGARSQIAAGVVLHAGVIIGAGVKIGCGTQLHPGVVVLDRCVIGERCLLQPGVVIGADGFGFRPSADGPPVKVPHAGAVRIGNDVEIGANSTVDRGKFSDTVIGDGTKIDNLVQIGHNCVIGRGCIICGMVGLAGSVTLGDGVTLAGNVGVADGRRIGDGATIGGKAGVMSDVPAGETWLGAPAVPSRQAMRQFAAIEALPAMLRPLRKLLDRFASPDADA